MNDLLTLMGITQWRQRIQQEPVSEIVPELEPEPTVVPRFIFVAESSQADRTLLSNIIKALAVEEKDCQMIWVNTPAELQQTTWADAPIIVFGEDLYAHAPAQAIRTVSLTSLNHNIPAKKVLWHQLKSYT